MKHLLLKVYKILRSQLTGGSSLIFCRLAISGKTKICSHEIENPETIKKFLVWTPILCTCMLLLKIIPLTIFVAIKKKIFSLILVLSLVFNRINGWVALPLNKTLFYKLDLTWRKKEWANTICQWTVILSNTTRRINFSVAFSIFATDVDGTLQETHPLKNIPHEAIWKETEDNRRKLGKKGFRVMEMRECEWLKIRKQLKVSCFLKR